MKILHAEVAYCMSLLSGEIGIDFHPKYYKYSFR